MDGKSSIEIPEIAAGGARRRSTRVHIAIPVIVRRLDGKAPLEELARTIRVNAHGCSVHLKASLEASQRVLLVNPATREEVACTVISLSKKAGELTEAGLEVGLEVGLEFAQPSPLFWRIHFPPDDWNPEDRKLPTGPAPLSSRLPRR